MEAITGPVGTPRPTSAASDKLQARFDGFRHRIGDADGIEMAGVGGVAGARDDEHFRPHRAHHAHDLADGRLVVDGDDDGGGLHHAAALEKGRVGGVAVVDLAAPAPIGSDGGRIAVGREEREAVLLQQLAHHLAHAAVPDDDGAALGVGRRSDEQCGVERLLVVRSRT